MPEVILYIAASLDGYIARPDGSVDWLDEIAAPEGMPPESDYGYADFLAGVGVVFMGRITYQQILSFGVDYPYIGTIGYVVSDSRAGEKDANVSFTAGANLPSLVERLKREQNKNLWLVGGGRLIREFLRLNLIDRIELFIMPIILGAGLPLFPAPTVELYLTLVNCRPYANGVAQLTYHRAEQEGNWSSPVLG